MPSTNGFRAFAPAKVNLTLHVCGQRDDGYHLLDSLVAFVDIGDTIEVTPAPKLSLTATGLDAEHIPTGATNLILKAHQAISPDLTARISLHKGLPMASGIGGGSSDAAAYTRLLQHMMAQEPTPSKLTNLGADVLACWHAQPLRMRGIGEEISPVQSWPKGVHVVLATPRSHVSTPAIFANLTAKVNPPMPAQLPLMEGLDQMVEFLNAQRNDLQPPAISQLPVIAKVVAALSQTSECRFARMSGSGATCFGLYPNEAAAKAARAQLSAMHPDWWVAKGRLFGPGEDPFDIRPI